MTRLTLFSLSVLLICCPSETLAWDKCSHKTWNWKVDRKAALELQQFVNEGHEPWRMDGLVEVANEGIANRQKDWADSSTILNAPKLISQTKDTAILEASSQRGRVRYEVTLRKYSWLVHSARDNWNWVIWLSATIERTDCPMPVQ